MTSAALVRACLFDAAGNHVVLGWVDHPGLASARVHTRLREVAWARLTGKQPELFAVVRGRGSRVRASFWNPDGTRERLCGNAVRCIPSCLALGGRYRFSAEPVVVETGIGTLLARSRGPGQGTAEAHVARPLAGFRRRGSRFRQIEDHGRLGVGW